MDGVVLGNGEDGQRQLDEPIANALGVESFELSGVDGRGGYNAIEFVGVGNGCVRGAVGKGEPQNRQGGNGVGETQVVLQSEFKGEVWSAVDLQGDCLILEKVDS